MKRHLAGIACTVESPSSYRIEIPVNRHGYPIQASWIAFTGAHWTIAWQFGDKVTWSDLRFPSALAVAEYLVAISNSPMEDFA